MRGLRPQRVTQLLPREAEDFPRVTQPSTVRGRGVRISCFPGRVRECAGLPGLTPSRSRAGLDGVGELSF